MKKSELVNSFKNKRVFITGHTGFKGSWLTMFMNNLGAVVKGYSDTEENFDLYKMIDGNSLCESVIADIRDFDRLKKEILDFKPDFVFHLAAQPLVRLSYSLPKETFDINFNGTLALLEVLREYENECYCVVITTDKVYKNNELNKPFTESDPLGGHDPYSSSKATAEILVESYNKSFFLNSENIYLASARGGNVIGGGDFSLDRLIPDIMKGLIDNKEIVIRNPFAVRPWQHVLECLSGYMSLAVKLTTKDRDVCGPWNFGPHDKDSLTVGEVAELAVSLWGSGELNMATDKSKLHESTYLRLDINKSLQKLDWEPKYDSQKAVKLCTEWYREVMSTKSISALDRTNSEIEEYLLV